MTQREVWGITREVTLILCTINCGKPNDNGTTFVRRFNELTFIEKCAAGSEGHGLSELSANMKRSGMGKKPEDGWKFDFQVGRKDLPSEVKLKLRMQRWRKSSTSHRGQNSLWGCRNEVKATAKDHLFGIKREGKSIWWKQYKRQDWEEK